MVIVRLMGGFGNQFGQYVNARLLAYKLNTELKFDMDWFNTNPEFIKRSHSSYRLSAFNVMENFATPEEIKRVKETGLTVQHPLPDLKNLQGDIYMRGQWPRNEKILADILDIVRKEFTLKKPLSPTAEILRQKILSSECSVAMHFRHGDFAYHPAFKTVTLFSIVPLDYYYTCLDLLKYRYNTPHPTAFIFSDNMPWIKENLHLDVPTEFVEGCETDDEEFILMSLCKHMIRPLSTFSESAAVLNTNSDKKIFVSKVAARFAALFTTSNSEKIGRCVISG